MATLNARSEQFQTFVARKPDGPLYVLNLDKFKERAEYAHGRHTSLTPSEERSDAQRGSSGLCARAGRLAPSRARRGVTRARSRPALAVVPRVVTPALRRSAFRSRVVPIESPMKGSPLALETRPAGSARRARCRPC